MGVLFITGAPGCGKSTVAAILHEKLRCPWFEFGWIPEFRNLNPHTKITYEEEERISFENLMLVTENYLRHGFETVILTDIREEFTEEVRTRFGQNVTVIILYSASDETLRRRVLERDNGNGYRNADEAVRINRRFVERPAAAGEIRLQCDNITAENAADSIIKMGESQLKLQQNDD